MNENLKQPKYYNRFKDYLKEKDINTNKIIHAIKEIELSPGGGTNVGYGLPLPLYTPDPDAGTFLTVDKEGKISNIGQIIEDGILLNINKNNFNISWMLNNTSGGSIPKGSVISVGSNRTDALFVVGDLSILSGMSHHTSGLFVSTSYKDVDNETELTSSSFINLPDFISFNLLSDNEELESGFTNGDLPSGSYTETLHFPRFYSNDVVNNTSYNFGLLDNKVVLLNNGISVFKLPNISPDYKGKTFTSGSTPSDIEWKFIDENRVKTDSSGVLSIIPDYNEGNVYEYTAINGGTLSIGLPINMPNGADMKLRFLPTATTSFAPEVSYFFNTTKPGDLQANKFVEMQIRKFQGNFYANLIIWE